MGQVIYRGGHVIVDPEEAPGDGTIRDGAVVVEGRDVVDVGTFSSMRERWPVATVTGSPGHVVIPGLINTHHHGVGMSWTRMGVPDSYLERWLIAAFQMKPLDPTLDTLWGDMQNLRSGVTTTLHSAYDRHWLPYDVETFAKVKGHAQSGIRAYYGVHLRNERRYVYGDDSALLGCLPPALSASFQELLREFRPLPWQEFNRVYDELLTAYADNDRIEIMLSPLGPQWVSEDSLRRIRRLATDSGALIHLHCLETWRQHEFARTGLGMTMVEFLDRLGFLADDVSLGHGVWLSESDMRTLGSCGCSVCHNASSNLRTGAGIAPVRAMREAGVNVSLGMDNFTLGDDEDMLAEMRLVSALHRFAGAGEAAPTNHHDALRMATVGGARTLNASGHLGKLLPGYRADLVCLRMDAIATPYLDPRITPCDAVVQWGRTEHVDTVVVNGRVVLADGAFTELDEPAIVAELARLAGLPASPEVARWCETMKDVEPYIDQFYESWDPPQRPPWYSINTR